MRYFLLEDDMSMRMQGRWYIGRVTLPDGSEPYLNAGVRLDEPRWLHASITHIGRVLEFSHTSFGVPLSTPALADALVEAAGSDIQIFPITIAEQSGMMVLNATRSIRCVNEKHSKFQKFTEDDTVRPDLAGQYRYISRLVLDKAAIPSDAHFFRIKDYEIALIVSEAVKNAMERVGCYGAEFTELEMA